MTEQFALEKYQFKNVDVRVLLDENNDPWFVAKDVCDILDISNPSDALKRLDDDERARFKLGRQGETNVINEAGLYVLVLGSRKAEAHEFKRWVTHEVLPSIRKHGAYMNEQTIEQVLTSPDFLIKLATQLKNEQEARKQAEAQLEQAKPKVLFADCVSGSKTSILVGELAKILTSNGMKIGQNNLFQWMRDNGYLGTSGNRYNIPTVKSISMGIMEIKERPYWAGDHMETARTPKITGKGQIYFINLFLSNKTPNGKQVKKTPQVEK